MTIFRAEIGIRFERKVISGSWSMSGNVVVVANMSGVVGSVRVTAGIGDRDSLYLTV